MPNRFVSVGPWPSDAVVAAWRADPAFQTRLTALRELVEGFEPHTLDPVVRFDE